MCRSFFGNRCNLGYNRYTSETCQDCIGTAADETHSLFRLQMGICEMELPVEGRSQVFLASLLVREKDVSWRKCHRWGISQRSTDDQIVAPCD